MMPQNDGDPNVDYETWGGVIICWQDYDDPDYRYYEKVRICVSHKSDETFNVPLRFISAATLAPTGDITLPGNVEIAGIENGKITFNVTYVTPPDNDAPRIKVGMKAPEGAVGCRHVYSADNVEELRMENGIAYIENFYSDFAQNSRVDERLYTIVWTDADGMVVDYGFLWTYVIPADNRPWACFAENWHAVDAARLEYINGASNCGVELTYDQATGTLHTGYNNTVSISGEPGNIVVNIKAPEGAACYRANGSGGNVILGKDDWMVAEQHYVVTQQEYVMLGDDRSICIRDHSPFREVNAGPVTVYIQEGAVWEYGGGVNVIYLYASEEDAINDPENPMYIEYICDTNGTLCQEKRVPLVSEEAAITGPVKEITAVGSYPWNLVVRRYPQKGSNAFHWELYMENETGAYQPLKGNMVFYVPYPKGHDNHTKYTYELRHYNDEHISFSLVDVRRTEYGLRFEVSSLSPFVMSWDEMDISSILTLPSGLRQIGDEAFAGMNMEKVVLPDGVTAIGARAFADCESLVSINLPDSVSFIADDAFSGCDNLTVTVSGTGYALEWCKRNKVEYIIK